MSEKAKITKGGFDEILAPNSALCGEDVNMPIHIQVENDLEVSVRVLVKFVTVEDVTTLFIEVAKCQTQK